MILSGKITSPNVTLSHSLSQNKSGQPKSFKVNSGQILKSYRFSSSNFASGSISEGLKVQSDSGANLSRGSLVVEMRNKTKAKNAQRQKVKPQQAPKKPAEPPIQPEKIIERQAKLFAPAQPMTQQIQKRYFIEGTQHLPGGRGMICGADKNTGDIHCDIPFRPNVDVVFDVQNFTDYNGIIDNHMEEIFSDTCVVNVPEGEIQVCNVSMELALIQYDQFIFACEYLNHVHISDEEKIASLFPKCHQELTPEAVSMFGKQMYETFNMDNFYKYCRMNSADRSNEFEYAFCDLDRDGLMEQIIVTHWIKNHVPFEEAKKEFLERIEH